MANKKVYISPTIDVAYIELDQGIAVGSAIVRPGRDDDQVMEEYEIESQTINIDW